MQHGGNDGAPQVGTGAKRIRHFLHRHKAVDALSIIPPTTAFMAAGNYRPVFGFRV